MRSTSSTIPSLFSAFLLLLSSASQVHAHPYPRDDIHDVGYSYLVPRAGGKNVYTTTWTETNTFTSTVTTKWAEAAPTPVDKSVPCVPQNSDWTPCGWVCCDYWQQCAVEGQCVAKPGFEDGPPGGGGGGGGAVPTVITTDGVVTTLYSAPFRVTGTGTASPAPTFDAGQPEETNGGGGLSAGAIAGIVIGSLAAVGLLLMICFCCIAKGLWGLIFGGKKKNRERTREEIYDEKYTRSSRPSSYYTKKDHHSTWYGSSSAGTRPEKKKKSGAKWLGIGAMAATLLALLNIKKDKKPPSRRTPTMYSSSYMTGTGTSPSSSSSGGPSRHHSRSGTHRSPRSYYSHHTRQTGGPRSSRRSSRH